MRLPGWLVDRDHTRASSLQFGLLLILMLAWLIALPLATTFGGTGEFLKAAFAFVAVQALLITSHHPRQRAFAVGCGLLIVLDATLEFPGVMNLISGLVIGGVLILIPVRLSTYVLEQKDVDANTVFGALCAYLFMGMSWSVVYAVVDNLAPGSFAGPEGTGLDFQTLLYFSFTTLTTLGYGDVAPQNSPARMLSVLEALIGQVYLVVVVARLVSSEMESRREDREDT